MLFHPPASTLEELKQELDLNLGDLLSLMFYIECIYACRNSCLAFFPAPTVRQAMLRAADYVEEYTCTIQSVSRLLLGRLCPPK